MPPENSSENGTLSTEESALEIRVDTWENEWACAGVLLKIHLHILFYMRTRLEIIT